MSNTEHHSYIEMIPWQLTFTFKTQFKIKLYTLYKFIKSVLKTIDNALAEILFKLSYDPYKDFNLNRY